MRRGVRTVSEVRTVLAAALLASGVAAAVAAGMVRLAAGDGSPRIATVRLAELAAEHGSRAVRADASAEETAADVRAWAFALERALGEVARTHRVVLLPARAVAAGAPDLTGEVEATMARALDRTAAPRAPAPEAPP